VRYPEAPSSSRLTRVLGWSALATLALNTWWGLWVSPPDVVQGQFVRMLYVHPAVATMCYTGLTLTAILFALSLGYLALRRAIDNPYSRSLASSMVALLMALTVVVDHYATSWWNTLHQGTTLLQPDPTIHGWQLATMLLSFLAFGLTFAWMLVHRYRLEVRNATTRRASRWPSRLGALKHRCRRPHPALRRPGRAPLKPRSRSRSDELRHCRLAVVRGHPARVLVAYPLPRTLAPKVTGAQGRRTSATPCSGPHRQAGARALPERKWRA